MPIPQITHTFVNDVDNSVTADKMNTNADDLYVALSDGTKDISINNITLASSGNLSGSSTELASDVTVEGEYTGGRMLLTVTPLYLYVSSRVYHSYVTRASGSLTGVSFYGTDAAATNSINIRIYKNGAAWFSDTAYSTIPYYTNIVRGTFTFSAGDMIVPRLSYSGTTSPLSTMLYELAFDS